MLPFLDFDGVLHPDRSTIDQFFCRLPLLETWLRKHPTVDVAISSSWRAAHPIEPVGRLKVVPFRKDQPKQESRRSLGTKGVTVARSISSYMNALLERVPINERTAAVDAYFRHAINTCPLPGGTSASDDDDQERLMHFLEQSRILRKPSNETSGWVQVRLPFHPLRGQRFQVPQRRRVSGSDTLILRDAARGSFAVPVQ